MGSWTVIPITWRSRRVGKAKLAIKEMGSGNFLVCLYIWFEKYFSRGITGSKTLTVPSENLLLMNGPRQRRYHAAMRVSIISQHDIGRAQTAANLLGNNVVGHDSVRFWTEAQRRRRRALLNDRVLPNLCAYRGLICHYPPARRFGHLNKVVFDYDILIFAASVVEDAVRDIPAEFVMLDSHILIIVGIDHNCRAQIASAIVRNLKVLPTTGSKAHARGIVRHGAIPNKAANPRSGLVECSNRSHRTHWVYVFARINFDAIRTILAPG